MVGAIDGDHCEREQLFCTNTVSGWPLRIVPMPVNCQPSSSAASAASCRAANGISHTTFMTQLCGVSQSAGPLL